MTEHSIAELERQFDAAKSRKAEADRAFQDAKDRLRRAFERKKQDELEAEGIVLGRSLVRRISKYSGIDEGVIVGLKSNPYTPSMVDGVFAPLKKDGTPSARAFTQPFDRLELVRNLDEQP